MLKSILKSIDEKLNAEIEPISNLERKRDLLEQRLDFIDDYISRLTKLQLESGIAESATVKELKSLLKAIGEDTEGTKEELIQRLRDVI